MTTSKVKRGAYAKTRKRNGTARTPRAKAGESTNHAKRQSRAKFCELLAKSVLESQGPGELFEFTRMLLEAASRLAPTHIVISEGLETTRQGEYVLQVPEEVFGANRQIMHVAYLNPPPITSTSS